GALWVTTEPEQNPTPRGGTAYGSYDDPNGGRLKVEPLAQGEVPEANVGDELAGTTRGPLYYSAYGGYLVKAAEVGEHVDGGLERTRAQEPQDGRLSVATYNVENLSAGSGQEVFDRLAEGIVDNLAAPAVVGLEEVQDDSGPDDDGTVTPEATLKRLTDAVSAAGGPAYQWRQIDPEAGADGGQPGGNIRNVFLFDPERVSFTDRERGDAATPVEVVDGADGRIGRRAAGRQAPERLPVRPRAGLLRGPGGRRRRHPGGGGGRRRRAGARRLPGPDRPRRRGLAGDPQAAGRRVRVRGAP